MTVWKFIDDACKVPLQEQLVNQVDLFKKRLDTG